MMRGNNVHTNSGIPQRLLPQVGKWKKQLQSELPQIFSTRREKRHRDNEALHAQLYQQIGQLKVELDWLKKKSGLVD